MTITERQTQAARELMAYSVSVREMAVTMEELGMSKAATKLLKIAVGITRSTEDTQKANHEDLMAQVKRYNESSQTMLEAALAGVKLGESHG